MLEVKNLYVNYGAVEAIKGISFTVQGRFVYKRRSAPRE